MKPRKHRQMKTGLGFEQRVAPKPYKIKLDQRPNQINSFQFKSKQLSAQIYFLMSNNIIYYSQLYVHVMWLAIYSYVCIPRRQQSKSVNPFAVLAQCTHLYNLRQIRAIYKFCGISRKGTHLSLRVPVRNCSEQSLVYDCTFDFFLARCHFLYIVGSRVSHKK